MGRGKVFVVEQAELMKPAAQNALLKTLEEPAGRTLIILLTDQPDALLPTIRSRCQSVRFAPLDEQTSSRRELRAARDRQGRRGRRSAARRRVAGRGAEVDRGRRGRPGARS